MADDKPKRVQDRLKPMPWYAWYPIDYRASRNANRLDYVQRGLYRELLDECWVEGAIPDDIEKLADIARCPIGVMAEAWPTLRKLFVPLDGLDGMFLSSKRLEIERSADDALRVARANAGRKGGLARAENAKQKQANPSDASSNLASTAVQSISPRSKALQPLGASGPLGGLTPALCPFCGVDGGHAADCKPSRLSPAERT
jgi:uncharacterized protein YdaU (DUF1376 family)